MALNAEMYAGENWQKVFIDIIAPLNAQPVLSVQSQTDKASFLRTTSFLSAT